MAMVLHKRNVKKEIDMVEPAIPEAIGDGLPSAPLTDSEPDPAKSETTQNENDVEEVSTVKLTNKGKLRVADVPKYLAQYKDDRVAPKVWFSLIKDIPSEYWQNCIIYAYRVLPRIIRKRSNPNNPSNIGSYVQPFTSKEFLNMHGWGMYKLTFNDTTRKVQTCVCWCVWRPEVAFDEYPPKLDLKELDVDNPDNRAYVDYLKILGKLDSGGNIVEGNAVQQHSGTDPGLLRLVERLIERQDRSQSKPDSELQAITKAIDLVSKGGEKATEMVLKQVGNNDPMNTIKLVEAILNTSKGDGKQAELLHVEMMDLRKQNTELMMKLIERANAPAPDPLESLLKYKELLTALREDNDSGGRAMNWKDKAIEIGIPVLGNVINVIAMAMAQKNGVTVNTQPVQQAEPGNAGELPPAQPDPQAEIRGHLNMYSPLIVRAVARGENGANFAESIVTMFGIESGVYPAIAAMGKDGILTALQSNAQTWQQLAPMAQRLDVFIDEFLAFEKEENDNETK